ncbi:kinase-like protein [Annulohypoxylon nitens]|nr:kinase-like protein [Annulohypoxylon nitens]
MSSNHSKKKTAVFAREHKTCTDRGNKLWRDAQARSNPNQHVHDSLSSLLWNSRTSTSNGLANCFIPLNKLVLARDRRLAKHALQESDTPPEQINTLLSRICDAGDRSFFRIFAILILCERTRDIKRFIDEKVDDSYLPLPGIEKNGNNIIALQQHARRKIENKKLNTIFKGWSRNDLTAFKNYQWWAIAPFFGREKSTIPHYVLEPSDILPIIEKRDKLDLEVEKLDKEVQDLFQGGFGDVSLVKLHPSHYYFPDQPYCDGDNLFALKRLRSRNRNEFQAEVNALRKYDHGIDEHQIPLLATFEKDDDAGRFYMLFPKANGDLRHFWETEFTLSMDPALESWMARQCLGLARTLSIIHKDQSRDNTPNAHGRHGDIKAGNILWFSKPNTFGPSGWRLVLADFGLTTFHRALTISAQTAGKLHRTVTYQAPEFDIVGAKVSRKSDIWALGCTYLDFATCFVLGYGAVQNDFPTCRAEQDERLGISEDKFYHIEADRTSAVLKTSVRDWIVLLRTNPKSTPYLNEFLSLIEDRMLCIDAQDRPTASQVADALQALIGTSPRR